MRKRLMILGSFLLGILVGLFFTFYFCDSFLGSRLSWSRTRVSTSTYSLRVKGGIISVAEPYRVHIRATALAVEVSFRGARGRHGESVVVEVDNLPRGFKVDYQGPGLVSEGGNSFTVVISLRRRETVSRFSITPPEHRTFTFWVGGDNRERLDLLLELLERASVEHPLFVVLGGDLVPRGLWWQYEKLLGVLDESPVPVFPLPGNHDLEFCGRRCFTRHLAPDHYWFSYSDSLFVLLDTNGRDRGQLSWLEKVLSQKGFKHRFVFVHKPPFDPRKGYNHAMGDRRFAAALLRLLVKDKVDVLFCSHIHSFIETHYKGLKVVITGGLGAHRKKPLEPFHYVAVKVGPQGVSLRMVKLAAGR